MHCRTFGSCTRGSDPRRGWKATDCKCALEALLKGVFPKGPTEQHMHLNPAARQNQAANSLTTNALRGFGNCTRGSDASRARNATACKCAPEVLLAGVFPKGPTEQHMHLNRKEIQEIHRNTLRNFTLRGFNRHLPWFRCSGKE